MAAIRKNAESVPAQLMSEMSRANTIIRDSLNDSFSQIAVDDEAMYNEIRNYIKLIDPSMVKIVKLYKGNVPIFDNFDISKQIKSLFAKYVSLRRGAYLIIEHTEAMNVIDVNSGNRTKAEDNQEQTAMDVNLRPPRRLPASCACATWAASSSSTSSTCTRRRTARRSTTRWSSSWPPTRPSIRCCRSPSSD